MVVCLFGHRFTLYDDIVFADKIHTILSSHIFTMIGWVKGFLSLKRNAFLRKLYFQPFLITILVQSRPHFSVYFMNCSHHIIYM